MRTPCDFADGVFMSWEDDERALIWGANIEGADHTVDAGGGDDGWAIFVPIVS